jgi:hypothetical protein
MQRSGLWPRVAQTECQFQAVLAPHRPPNCSLPARHCEVTARLQPLEHAPAAIGLVLIFQPDLTPRPIVSHQSPRPPKVSFLLPSSARHFPFALQQKALSSPSHDHLTSGCVGYTWLPVLKLILDILCNRDSRVCLVSFAPFPGTSCGNHSPGILDRQVQ